MRLVLCTRPKQIHKIMLTLFQRSVFLCRHACVRVFVCEILERPESVWKLVSCWEMCVRVCKLVRQRLIFVPVLLVKVQFFSLSCGSKLLQRIGRKKSPHVLPVAFPSQKVLLIVQESYIQVIIKVTLQKVSHMSRLFAVSAFKMPKKHRLDGFAIKKMQMKRFGIVHCLNS